MECRLVPFTGWDRTLEDMTVFCECGFEEYYGTHQWAIPATWIRDMLDKHDNQKG
jgi:hypothetical protein